MRFSILCILLFFQAVSIAGPSPAWRRIRHEVAPGETLRLISRKYFGHKQGAICLQGQLRLMRPDLLKVGDILEFSVPPEAIPLSTYQGLDIDCSPTDVRIGGQSVVLTRPVEASIVPLSPPLREPYRPWVWSGAVRFGGGIAYSDIGQRLENSDYDGDVGFRSFRAPAYSLSGEVWVNDQVGFTAYEIWLPIRLTVPAASGKGAEFRTRGVLLSWKPAGLRTQKFGWTWSPWMGVGHVDARIPFAEPTSLTEVEARSFDRSRQQVGIGFYGQRDDRWHMGIQFSWGLGRATDTAFGGHLHGERIWKRRWIAGFSWEGESLRSRFRSWNVGGESRMFYSYASLQGGFIY
jgi:hypothetical protein